MNEQQYIEHLIASHAWQEAMELITIVEAKDVDTWDSWKHLADSQFQEERFPVACEAYERMTLMRPLPADSQVMLGYCYLRMRKRDLADIVLGHVLACPEKLKLPDLELATRVAIRMKSLDLLEKVSNEGRRRFPEVALFWFAAGETAKGRGLDKSAVTYYEKAVEQDPDNIAFRIALCQQQISCQQFDAASKTLDINVSNIDSLANLLRVNILFNMLDDQEGLCACQAELTTWYYRITSEFRQDS